MCSQQEAPAVCFFFIYIHYSICVDMSDTLSVTSLERVVQGISHSLIQMLPNFVESSSDQTALTTLSAVLTPSYM